MIQDEYDELAKEIAKKRDVSEDQVKQIIKVLWEQFDGLTEEQRQKKLEDIVALGDAIEKGAEAAGMSADDYFRLMFKGPHKCGEV